MQGVAVCLGVGLARARMYGVVVGSAGLLWGSSASVVRRGASVTLGGPASWSNALDEAAMH